MILVKIFLTNFYPMYLLPSLYLEEYDSNIVLQELLKNTREQILPTILLLLKMLSNFQ